jgi:hypothetical protein
MGFSPMLRSSATPSADSCSSKRVNLSNDARPEILSAILQISPLVESHPPP